MPPPRVLICGDIVWAHDETNELLGSVSEIIRMDSPSRAHFLAQLKAGGKYEGIVAIYRHNSSADRIGIFDGEIIQALKPSVRWIAHNGAGYDQIDVNACKAAGIRVSNTPGAVDDATATTALYLLVSSLRQFSKAERNVRSGQWKSGLKPAHDPSAKTLAIWGMGGIGLRFAHMARALGMRILYHNRRRRDDVPEWCEYFPQERLTEMLGQTDVLSIHIPLKKETENLIGEKEIRSLKKGSTIINTARGKVLDEAAMIRALEDGHLYSIGLDVYPDEPKVNPRLFEFPQATLLPHMGTETEESQRKMEVRALTNVRDYLLTGMGKDLVPEMRNAS